MLIELIIAVWLIIGLIATFLLLKAEKKENGKIESGGQCLFGIIMFIALGLISLLFYFASKNAVDYSKAEEYKNLKNE